MIGLCPFCLIGIQNEGVADADSMSSWGAEETRRLVDNFMTTKAFISVNFELKVVFGDII
jgi:hypothetical protein